MQASTISNSSTHMMKYYFSLLKPRVMSLVVFTGIVGMFLAPGSVSAFTIFMATFCIALGSGAAGAFNMWYERDVDARMTRTKNRPIPMGRIEPKNALNFSAICAALSVYLMAITVNYLSAALLLGAILFYSIVYTMWLKPSTPQNIVIGGAAGALPPVIGWAAVSGSVSIESITLFMIIFLWTPPHFWALALYRGGDYEKVGIPMMPSIIGKTATIRLMMAYTLVLLAVTLVPYFIGSSGWIYLVSAILLGGFFMYHMVEVMIDPIDANARKMFVFSIFYLFFLFVALVLDGGIL